MNLTNFAESAGHLATPLEGRSSWLRKDGSPADPRRAGHYPIVSRCKTCRDPIWLAGQLQMEWWHVQVKVAAPGPPGGDLP